MILRLAHVTFGMLWVLIWSLFIPYSTFGKPFVTYVPTTVSTQSPKLCPGSTVEAQLGGVPPHLFLEVAKSILIVIILLTLLCHESRGSFSHEICKDLSPRHQATPGL